MPSADASTIRASRHARGNLEPGVKVPNASLVDAEDDEVFGGDRADVGFVDNGECATTEVVDAVGVELGKRLARAWVVGRVACLTSTRYSDCLVSKEMDGSGESEVIVTLERKRTKRWLPCRRLIRSWRYPQRAIRRSLHHGVGGRDDRANEQLGGFKRRTMRMT